MTRPVRLATGGLLVLALAGGVFLVPTLWGTPWKIEHFYLRTLVDFALDHPMLLYYVRVLEPYGLDYYSGDLEDLSVEAQLAQADEIDAYLEGLRRYDRRNQSPEQLVSTDVLEWLLQTRQAGRPFLFHSYPVNQFQGWQSFLPDFMVNFHQVDDEGDARSYLERLSGFGTALDQLGDSMRYRARRGILPPRFVLEAVQRESGEFVACPPVDNALYAKLRDSLDEIEGLAPSTREELLAQARERIESVVYPGYRRLLATLAGLAGRASDDAGVWKLPDGEAYYRWTLRWHTTTDLDPDEIHDIGLREIARIHREMREILDREGIQTRDPISTILDLSRQARFLYPDGDRGRTQILADYQAIIDETQGRLPELFGRLPRAPVVVERVPPFKEAGSPGAYYNPPPLDDSRPGIFYANLRDVAEIQKFRMRTLAFHEAIPGHHLQISLAMENRELPLFRRFVPLTAFVEGWALYAERIAAEAGFHETAYDRLGALSAEAFRAARLAVDTGIHARRWTRGQAIDYMVNQAGLTRADAVTEVERYIVNPGQACAYKIGELKILELRDRARARLGADFDLRAFHDAVLENGALPLSVLERVVEGWIDARS